MRRKSQKQNGDRRGPSHSRDSTRPRTRISRELRVVPPLSLFIIFPPFSLYTPGPLNFSRLTRQGRDAPANRIKRLADSIFSAGNNGYAPEIGYSPFLPPPLVADRPGPPLMTSKGGIYSRAPAITPVVGAICECSLGFRLPETKRSVRVPLAL